jgi:hypothetical protein
MMSDSDEKKTPPLWLAAAWIVVALPLAWGVYQTAVKSRPLFRASTVVEVPVRADGAPR